jgi:hypothetical protein
MQKQSRFLKTIYIEKMDPVGPMRNLRIPLRIATVVGAVGGFLYAYQNSSCKFHLVSNLFDIQ